MSKSLFLKEYNTVEFQAFLMQKGFVDKIHIDFTSTTFKKAKISIQVPRGKKQLTVLQVENLLALANLSNTDFEAYTMRPLDKLIDMTLMPFP